MAAANYKSNAALVQLQPPMGPLQRQGISKIAPLVLIQESRDACIVHASCWGSLVQVHWRIAWTGAGIVNATDR